MRSGLISAASAALVATVAGVGGTLPIVLAAAQAVGATPEQASSWVSGLGLATAVSALVLSVRYRMPIITAWSTPGAALLVTGLSGLNMSQAIGAFLFASLLITICGVTGWFQRIMQYIPRHIAAAMLAGILVRFGMELFTAMQSQWALVGLMFAAFLLGRAWLPRYTVPLALAVGVAYAGMRGLLHLEVLNWTPAKPLLMMPDFSLSALVGVGIPLFIVTMTSQNVPGLAVLRANGYETPASPLISWTGFTGLLLGPFGGYSFNLAAITAAICMSKDADPDPRKRYMASVWAGAFYLTTGWFGATVVGLFTAFPAELVAAIAGLALLGTIGASLAGALADETGREAALVTFLSTASGLSFLGIGSAFWGLVLGIAVHLLGAGKRARARHAAAGASL
ncbi:MAG: benzoate/H(+) symporter BenE family transporter, partial [Pollutimonas bauzanensis]